MEGTTEYIYSHHRSPLQHFLVVIQLVLKYFAEKEIPYLPRWSILTSICLFILSNTLNYLSKVQTSFQTLIVICLCEVEMWVLTTYLNKSGFNFLEAHKSNPSFIYSPSSIWRECPLPWSFLSLYWHLQCLNSLFLWHGFMSSPFQFVYTLPKIVSPKLLLQMWSDQLKGKSSVLLFLYCIC